MGLLQNGVWKDEGYDTKSHGGEFKRWESAFRNWLTKDGTPKGEGQKGFKAESGRYHLYVSHACPWANRTMIFRQIKDLSEHITVSVVHPHMLEHGWTFQTDYEGATGDTLYGLNYLYEVYLKAASDYSGRVTVPVLWDKKEETIVSNESADIIRMFNTAFNDITGNTEDFYPPQQQATIDALNERIYKTVNNGVYKAGFASTQKAYDKAIEPLFETLDWLEEKLKNEGPYLCGEKLTEADWRLFTSLIRFDAVYYVHFKCNLQRIQDYSALSAYVERLYTHPGVSGTIHFDHIKEHYYYSHDFINPNRIVPKGPRKMI
jgi:putative glutathione S-transferase